MRQGAGGEVKFRPDIEGLRGVAVLLVVLAHAHVPGLAGGFVGVDVFFVISGYLISGLLTEELERSGSVDFWAFYARRARRLAPALLTVVLAVAALCLLTLSGDVLQLQLDSGRWAALWLSNVYFAIANFDYFGVGARDSLLLHTWSLGVEEQFYLIWPALLLLAWKRFAGRRAWLVWIVSISFAVSALWMPIDAVGVYYLMPTRLWQLGLGGLVYLSCHGPRGHWLRSHSNVLGWAGAGLLLASLLLIDGSVAYPGWRALLPAFAAAGLLAAGTGSRNTVGRVLSSQAFGLPGRISYSWYLWHWPILMIGPLLGLWPLGGVETLAAILVSFLVSWASYAFVEQPVRRGGSRAPRRVVLASVLASIAVASLLHLAATLTRTTAAEPRGFGQQVMSLVTVPSVYSDTRCDQWYRSAELVPCRVEAGDGSAGLMVLIGDSIGTQWLPALQRVARSRGLHLVVLTKSSCPIVDEPFFYPRIHRRFSECEQWRESAIAYVQSMRPDVVVIGSAATYDFTRGQWIEGSRRIIDRLEAGTPRVLVLAPSPVLESHGPRCVMAAGRVESGEIRLSPPEACSTRLSQAEDEAVIAALTAAAEASASARLLYLNDLVCPAGLCSALRDGNLVYRDQQHLNASFADSLGKDVDRRFGEAVASPSSR